MSHELEASKENGMKDGGLHYFPLSISFVVGEVSWVITCGFAPLTFDTCSKAKYFNSRDCLQATHFSLFLLTLVGQLVGISNVHSDSERLQLETWFLFFGQDTSLHVVFFPPNQVFE